MGRVPPDSKKSGKGWEKEGGTGKSGENQEKRGNSWEKEEKIRKKRQKLERFFHFAPPD